MACASGRASQPWTPPRIEPRYSDGARSQLWVHVSVQGSSLSSIDMTVPKSGCVKLCLHEHRHNSATMGARAAQGLLQPGGVLSRRRSRQGSVPGQAQDHVLNQGAELGFGNASHHREASLPAVVFAAASERDEQIVGAHNQAEVAPLDLGIALMPERLRSATAVGLAGRPRGGCREAAGRLQGGCRETAEARSGPKRLMQHRLGCSACSALARSSPNCTRA